MRGDGGDTDGHEYVTDMCSQYPRKCEDTFNKVLSDV